jgi:CheY-like chemotaxis protein
MEPGRRVQIDISNLDYGEASGDFVRISVRDEGCGMSPAHLARVFDLRFSSKSDGTGFGLALSYMIVKRHKGMLTAESTLDVGTVFHIDLPALPKGTTLELDRRSADGKEHSRLRGRILLVEKETAVLEATGRLLGRLGLDVSYARDGRQAIALLRDAITRNSTYNVVMLDIDIQHECSASWTLERLRILDPTILAIGSTSQSEPLVPDGFCGTIRKPYDISAIHIAFSKAVAASDDADNVVSDGNSFQPGWYGARPPKNPGD